MKTLAAALVVLASAVPALAQDVAEPKSGTRFVTKDGDLSLLGVGLRKKNVTKMYAIGLYVAASALSGPLKGKIGTPELYREIVAGEFKKKLVLKFLRDMSADQIRGAFRDGLKGVGGKTDVWLGFFGDVRSGQECVIGWTPGTGLETRVAGLGNPALKDKALASAVFGIWLGEQPVQDDLKRDLVARSGDLIK